MPWGIAAAAVAAAGAIYSGVQANNQAKTQANIMQQQADRERTDERHVEHLERRAGDSGGAREVGMNLVSSETEALIGLLDPDRDYGTRTFEDVVQELHCPLALGQCHPDLSVCRLPSPHCGRPQNVAVA